jgi:hypothetical protein
MYYNPDLPSLASAFEQLQALPGESPDRIARVRSALATFGRLVGKSPSDIPAHAGFLRQQFSRFKRTPMGLSAKTIANCKTEVRYLVKTVCQPAGRSALRPLDGEWAVLRDQIPDQPALWKVSKLMAFCSGANIAPAAVNDATLVTFLEVLVAAGDVDEPERYHRSVIDAWNRLADLMPTWPQQKLTQSPAKSPRWTLDPAAFPDSFRAEIDRWETRLTVIDPEAEEGPVRAVRPKTIELHRHQINKAASALVFSGRPIETIVGLADLVEIDAFKTIMRYLRERNGGEPTTALYGVGMTLKAIARHAVKADPAHIERMGRICANYKSQIEGHETKSRQRLEQFDDERLLAALLHLPARLLAEAGLAKTPKRRAMILAQVAIAIELELHAPVRLANLASLRLGDNIQRIQAKGEVRWILRFGRDETKNHANLAYELPASCVQLIEKAMTFYAQPDGWLFPGRTSHKDSSLFSRQIKQEVERHLNVPFHLHLMRGLVATAQVKDNHGGFEMARAVLGDRSDRVIRGHYTAAAEQHLIRQAQDTIQRARLRTAPLVKAAERKTA